ASNSQDKRRFPRFPVSMRLFVILLSCMFFGCSSHQSVGRLNALYLSSVSIENASTPPNNEALWRRSTLIHSKGREFWGAYSDIKALIGVSKAHKKLRNLIDQEGVSVILIVPTLTDFRGPDEDEIIEQALLSGVRSTNFLMRVLGHPRNRQKIEACRKGLELF
ncbi:MAG: hypothetical protein ACK5S4_00515, partial [bacterium]